MKRKKTVLYLDKECAEVVRRDYRKYSKLEMDFILCGGTDEEIRRSVANILLRYIGEARSKSLIEHFINRLRPPYLIPFYTSRSEWIGIGKTIITARLRSNIIDRLISEGGVVDIVKEWCSRRKGRGKAGLTS
ncbi:MAG: hypothetical protein QXT64_01345 [Desulfurococcaceae archaeon]